jgi:hypothetical protein
LSPTRSAGISKAKIPAVSQRFAAEPGDQPTEQHQSRRHRQRNPNKQVFGFDDPYNQYCKHKRIDYALKFHGWNYHPGVAAERCRRLFARLRNRAHAISPHVAVYTKASIIARNAIQSSRDHAARRRNAYAYTPRKFR